MRQHRYRAGQDRYCHLCRMHVPLSEFRDHLLSRRHLLGEGKGAPAPHAVYVDDLTAAECRDLIGQTDVAESMALAHYGSLEEMRQLVSALVAERRLAPTAVFDVWLARNY